MCELHYDDVNAFCLVHIVCGVYGGGVGVWCEMCIGVWE